MARLHQNYNQRQRRGAVVIPVAFRRRFGMEEGTLVIAEGLYTEYM